MLNLRHHSLVAWQRTDNLFITLHRLTIQSFPAFERFESPILPVPPYGTGIEV
jgi:hypothetical protein